MKIIKIVFTKIKQFIFLLLSIILVIILTCLFFKQTFIQIRWTEQNDNFFQSKVTNKFCFGLKISDKIIFQKCKNQPI